MHLFFFIILFISAVFHVHEGFALSAPLSTEGNQIVDEGKKPVRIQGISWFGFETDHFVPQGLDIRSYRSMLNQMKALGFNAVRIPFSNEMFDGESVPIGINFEKNPDLEGLTPIEILDEIVAYAGQINLAIILDHHRSDAGIGASEDGLWYTEKFPEERFIGDWEMLAERYRETPAIIGADLHNEPHGKATWGDDDETTDWKMAAEKAGNAILAISPNWLILVEGIEFYQGEEYWWGSNLAGVKNAPILFDVDNKLVYSPHEYPKSIHEKPWHSESHYPDHLPAHFSNGWGYLFETESYPIIVGEFGSKFTETDDQLWMSAITDYLNGSSAGLENPISPDDKQGMGWIWWAWNPNLGESGGVLLDDWETPDDNKLLYLEPLLHN